MVELLRDRYELLEVVGQGGEGRVVKALDHQHDRVVALKIRRIGTTNDRTELLTEARILLAVPPHEHLPLVREDFFDGDQYIVAMDWVDGTDLRRLLQARGRPGLAPSMIMQWLADAAAALTHLHTQDPAVVHGDVKPANLILTQGGRVKLVDFGLSSSPDSPRRRGGTRGYAAPELLVKGVPDRRTDIYALAATAFALLTGEPPTGIRPAWEGIDPGQAAELEKAIRLGLATDPARRPETPGEFIEHLRAGWGATLPTGVLTFCLTDIEGSTELWERHPTNMANALVRHDQVVAATVEGHGGRFLKSMGEGDSTVSVFPSVGPAVDAALALTRELKAQLWPGGLELRARVALHTGEAEQRGGDYFGTTLNLAARLRGLADGGQVFCSSATAALVTAHLPGDVTLVDLGPHLLRGLREPEPVFALAAPGVDAPPAATECPYQGLLSFQADDAGRFFGREHIVDELLVRLRDHPFVAVVGGSGSGKSSVLQAGLATAAGGADVIHPGSEPLDALSAVIDSERLLIVDQFEELFTLCDDESSRRSFLDALLAVNRPVAIGLRADFYGECSGYPALATAVAASQVLLGPMSEAELRSAIVEPALLASLRLEPGLVDVLVGEVAGEPGALPLLSHALRATWQARNGRTLTLDGYRATGGVRGAIAATADNALDSLDPPDRDLARQLFLRLVEPGDGAEDTRRRARLDELTSSDDVEGRVTHVLDRVAAARLVTIDDAGVEVAHEALIREWPTLRAWLDEDRDGLRIHRHLTVAAHAWDSMGRDAAELYRGPRLAAAADLGRAANDFSPLEREFVAASIRRQERDVRRLRGVLGAVAVALVVALGAGGLALVQRGNADRSARRADVNRLAALSSAVRVEQPDLGLLLAVEANRLDDSPETRGALVGALGQSPRLVGELHGVDSGLESASFSPDGRTLATASFDGTILWDVATRKQIGEPLRDGQDMWLAAAFSPDGDFLAIPGDQGLVTLWDARTWKKVRQLDDPQLPFVGRIEWSHDGRLIAGGGGEGGNQVVLWDAASGHVLTPPVTTGPPDECGPAQPAFTTNDAVLAVAGRCGEVGLFFVPSLEPAAPPLRVTADPQWNIFTVAIAPDRPLLAIGAQNGEVSMWDLETRLQVGKTLSVGQHPALTVAFSPNGELLAAGSDAGVTFVWDVATGEEFGAPLRANGSRINAVAFSPDGTLLATTSYDRSGAIWDLTGRQPLGVPLAAPDEWVTSTSFSSDGELLATTHLVELDGTLVVREAETLDEVARVDADEALFDVAFQPDSHEIATAGDQGDVRFWDADTGRREGAAIELGDRWVTNVEYSPDGSLVAAATMANLTNGFPDEDDPSAQGTVQLFDAISREPVGDEIRPGAGGAVGLAFSPDGTRLAVASEAFEAQIFDVATQRKVGKPMAIQDTSLANAAFSPDGSRLAIGGFSGLVQVHEVATGDQAVPAMQDDALVSGIAFTPDGSMLTTTSLYGHTQLWDAASGTAIGEPLIGGAVPVPSTRFVDFLFPTYNSVTADGRRLAAAGIDGSAMLWDIDPSSWPARACAVAGRNLTRSEWRQYLGTRRYRATCPEWPT